MASMKLGTHLNADVLVLFAFNHTLVDVDSNVHIARALDADLANTTWSKNAADKKIDRAKTMDEFFVELAKHHPEVTHEDIRNAAQRLPFNQSILDAVRLVVDDFGATCKIVSDSTVFGVRSFLEHHGLADQVSEVVANSTHFEDGGKVLRVRPYHGNHLAPHGCRNCPNNLCKGVVLERILQQHRYAKVLYVGGGIEDFCPSTKLPNDITVIARNEVLSLPNTFPDTVQVQQWKAGDDVLSLLRNFFHQYPSKQVAQASVKTFSPISQVFSGSGQVLVVFDFDESLVNKDSDRFAFQCFHPELIKTLEERHALNPVWPSVFDELHQILANEKPELTPELICARVAQIPIQNRMVDAVRMAVEQFGAEVKIISDGNSLFIEKALKFHGLVPYINEVLTNQADLETMDNGRTRIRLRPHHDQPMNCSWCPSNLCKGSILDSIRNKKQYSHVLYVGDGIGDFCPASRLTKNDVVFARADEADGRSYGLQKRIDSNPTLIKASVVPWNTGDDIYRHFAQVLHAQT